MIATALGLALVALGLAGVRYASAIVAAQRRQRMTPIEADELEASDRVRVTKGTGVVFVVAGLALVAYGSGIV